MEKMHSLLNRQIRRFFKNVDQVPEELKPFLQAVNDAYYQSDLDRNMLERSLELSSDELLQANSQLRAIFKVFPDLFFLLDNEGTIINIKVEGTSDLFLDSELMIGRKIQDISFKDIGEKFLYAIKKLKTTGSMVSIEYSMPINDDEVYYEARLLPLLENQIIAIVRNITERKQAEIALKESEERARKILEASPDPIIVYDMQGNATYINQAFTRVFGWSPDEIIGNKVDYVPRQSRKKTIKMVDRVKKGESFSGITVKRTTKSKIILDISISASVWQDQSGNPVGSIVTLRDITEQKKLEARFLQAQKMEAVGVLAGGIAHDFNNLLTGIMGNTSLMLLKTDNDHPHYEKMKNIEEYVKSGASLTRQLLGFARGGKYQVTTIDLNELVENSSSLFGRTNKNICIQKNFQDEIWPVEVDKGQIEQVLLNLYVNAGNAMPDGGDLIIETRNILIEEKNAVSLILNPGRHVMVSISDTGVGISPDIQRKIFDPFFTTSAMGKGSGLGLASVYGIIKNHGGSIHVNSEKGNGATFSFYLPASREKIIETKILAEPIIKGPETILLVDDEEMIVDVGREILEELGYTVITALSGAEAIEIYKKEMGGIDLVILDMVMPEMGGNETYKKLKSIDPNINVLLASGYSLGSQAMDAFSMGVNGFIQKPFSLQTMSRKLRDLLDR